MTLSKSDILNAEDRTPEPVHVPEWATERMDDAVVDTVYVIGLTGDDASKLSGMENDEAFRVACAKGLCDETGSSLGFSEAEIALLGEKSMAALRRVYSRIEALSGLGGEATDEAVAKNSPTEATAGGGSPSASTTGSPSAG